MGSYRLHLYCTGEGSPAVILEAGSGGPGLIWRLVQKDVAGFTRVCSYDRAGFGLSDPAAGPLSPDQAAADLRELLATAGMPGPYILVGHSAGGLYNRAYASQYPSEVAGLVFVDSVHDQQRLHWSPEFVKLNNRASATYSLCKLIEPFGFVCLLKIVNMLFPGNTIPAEVRDAYFSTTYRSGFCRAAADEVEAVFAVYDRAQAGGHMIQSDQPELVINAIREIVMQLRSG